MRPVTLVDVAAGLPVTLRPAQPAHAGVGVSVYPVIDAPLSAGAAQASDTDPSSFATAVGAVGGFGAVAGTTALDAEDGELVPAEFVAVTANVYEVPVARPVTLVAAEAGLPVTLTPVQPGHAGVGVIVYEVIVAPLLAGAAQASPTDPSL